MKYDLYACAPAAHSSQRMQINFLKETVFFLLLLHQNKLLFKEHVPSLHFNPQGILIFVFKNLYIINRQNIQLFEF